MIGIDKVKPFFEVKHLQQCLLNVLQLDAHSLPYNSCYQVQSDMYKLLVCWMCNSGMVMLAKEWEEGQLW